MARAYSLNLLERLVAAVAAGESCRKVASDFKRALRTREVVAIITRYRERRRPSDGRQNRSYSLANKRAQLLALLLQIAWKKSVALPLVDGAFRFLRQPNRPSAVKPVANRGKLDGIGVAAAIDPSLEINKLPKLSGCPSEPNNPATES